MATLRHLASVQTQLQAGAVIDVDEDGEGEFGYLGELSGASERRAPGGTWIRPMAPPLLSTAFRSIQNGMVRRFGYCFRVFLPDGEGKGVGEASAGGADPTMLPDPQHSESAWCAYAWPEEAGVTGHRVFFINALDELLASDNRGSHQGYDGVARPPRADAAYPAAAGGRILGRAASGGTGSDGGLWQPVPE